MSFSVGYGVRKQVSSMNRVARSGVLLDSGLSPMMSTYGKSAWVVESRTDPDPTYLPPLVEFLVENFTIP